MSYEDAAIQFLATEENLPMALEIADIVNRMKPRLHREFWQSLHDNLSQRLAQSDKYGRWQVGFNFGTIDKYNQDWFSCSLWPLYIERDKHYFRLELQHGSSSSGYPLRYGFTRSHPDNRTKEDGLDEISKLSKAIQSDGFRESEWFWYIGIKFLDYACTEKAFLLRMANEKELFIDEMAQMMWDLFETHYDLLEDAHRALALVW